MIESVLSAPYFHNEEAAYAFVEARIWPRGPICPHRGAVETLKHMNAILADEHAKSNIALLKAAWYLPCNNMSN